MKRFHRFLKSFIWTQLVCCCCSVLQQCFHYVKHPEMYAFNSAPWYMDIAVSLTLTAITVLITLTAYFAVGRVISKRERNEAK